jgi:hypothetical protein
VPGSSTETDGGKIYRADRAQKIGTLSSELREKVDRLVDAVRGNAARPCDGALPMLRSYVEEIVLSQSHTSQGAITDTALELRRSPAKLRKALEVVHHELSETAKSRWQLSRTEVDELLNRPVWDALLWLNQSWWRKARDAVRADTPAAIEAVAGAISYLRWAHGRPGKRRRYGWDIDMIVGYAGNALDIAEGRRPRLTPDMDPETRRWAYSRPSTGGDPQGPFIRVATAFLQELCPDIEIRPDDIPHALDRLFRDEMDRDTQ